MKLTIRAVLLIGGLLVSFSAAYCQQTEKPPPPTVADPRIGPSLTVLRDEPTYQSDSVRDAIMVFATHTTNPPNRFLGIERSYTDDEIIRGLIRFYMLWRVENDDPTERPPPVILACQNWGCGAALMAPLKKLSEDQKIDVYLL
jgi:hypothetical protein